MYKAKYLSPMIPSFDIRKTACFFTDLLQFKTVRDEEHYIILHKDNLTVHILKAGAAIGEMEFYLEVDNLDKLWDDIKDKLEDVKFKAPFGREYGMKEIHIVVPATKTLLFIGQEVK